MTWIRRGRAGLLAGAAIPALVLTVAALSASSPRPATLALAGSTVQAVSQASGCTGVTLAVLPAQGFIANRARAQGGHFWWREAGGPGAVCVGSVVEDVWYTTTSTKTWRVVIYTAAHPAGIVAAERTFTLSAGWYWWSFGVHQEYESLRAVCVQATDGFGEPCVTFGGQNPAS